MDNAIIAWLDAMIRQYGVQLLFAIARVIGFAVVIGYDIGTAVRVELTQSPIGLDVPVLYDGPYGTTEVCKFSDIDLIVDKNIRVLIPEDTVRPAMKRVLEKHFYDGPKVGEILVHVEQWLAAYRRGAG